ncbi:MAG: immunoglobulin-like domain-containing protein [Candidatus Izemoplasmatales bacterium]
MKKALLSMLAVLVLFTTLACTETTTLDTVAPVLSGVADITYVIGESSAPTYAGVTAYDNLEGNITSKIVRNSTAVNLTVPGNYTVTFTVEDLFGNEATASLVVHVVDNDAPVITGIHGLEFVFGDDAPDYLDGVTATDNVDGDLTDEIVVDSSAVDLETVGVYTVTYTVEDASGNQSAVYSTFIQVKEFADDADLVPPVFNGQSNKTYTIGVSAAPNYLTGVTATDNVDGAVTADIVVNSAAVNLAVPGVYTVTYTVEDSSGNESQVSITVTVVKETVAPVISGIHNIEYYTGNAVPNYLTGVTATDNVDGDLSAAIVVDDDAVNYGVAGIYQVLYTVTDAAGNVTTAQATIVVYINPRSIADLSAIYHTYTSGTNNLNPYSETLATASELYGYLTDSLYTGDYDWAAAQAQVLEEDPAFVVDGDFDFEDWYRAGHTAGELPYNRFPAMAASVPQPMDEEGLVWRIALRQDLQFQDGTPIDAYTFDYSWRMLLDPLLLNDRASNLYDNAYLPLVGAEGYAKQNSPQTDVWGYNLYKVGEIVYSRENSYYGTVIGQPTWPLYYIETGRYDGLVGPGGALAYLEDWGRSASAYGVNGFVIENEYGDAFLWDASGNLIAPEAGWTLDGVPVPTTGTPDTTKGKGYAGARPAYMDEAQNRAAVDESGIPVGGATLPQAAVLWSEVGFKVIDQYTIELTLTAGKTAWDVMGNLTSGIVGVVHPAKFEAGMNEARTQTTYGTIENPLSSYGPYVLAVWETDVLYYYTLNPSYYAKDDYRITTVRYDVIADQSIAIEEFRAGRLDIVGAGGQYYNEFKYNLNMKLSPLTTFFRFAFNIQGSAQYELNPILVYPEFREAFYFAIDRETFSLEVRAPSLPTHGFLGPVYLSTEYNFVSYRGSQAGQSVLEDYAPDTAGYNPVLAKSLFDQAYAAAIAAGDITDGEMVSVEYKFYDVETNWQVANWVKSTVEAIFNQGESTPIFELTLAAVSSSALDQAWDNGDFEMTFGGWQGLNFDAPSMLGQVYNSLNVSLMLEKGFNTAGAEVTVSLPNSKAALEQWIADYEALETPTETQTAQYDSWVDLLALFVGDTLTCTFNELYVYAYGELYNVKDVNYAGKTDDFDNITAALETVLLDQMIAIPLFTSVGATVYSDRMVFEANEYHAWMGWGGLKYMYIATEAE